MYADDWLFYGQVQYPLEVMVNLLQNDFLWCYTFCFEQIPPVLQQVQVAINAGVFVGIEDSCQKELDRIQQGLAVHIEQGRQIDPVISDMDLSRNYNGFRRLPPEILIAQCYGYLQSFVWFLNGLRPFASMIESREVYRGEELMIIIDEVDKVFADSFQPAYNDFAAALDTVLDGDTSTIAPTINPWAKPTPQPEPLPDAATFTQRVIRRRRNFDSSEDATP